MVYKIITLYKIALLPFKDIFISSCKIKAYFIIHQAIGHGCCGGWARAWSLIFVLDQKFWVKNSEGRFWVRAGLLLSLYSLEHTPLPKRTSLDIAIVYKTRSPQPN